MIKVFPSIAFEDSSSLKKTLFELSPYCHGFHIDIADGKFVPRELGSKDSIKIASDSTNNPLMVHLMVEDPRSFISLCKKNKANMLIFHLEIKSQTDSLIKEVKKSGWLPGLAINPETPIENIFPFCSKIDSVLIMSVNPGASGQDFIESTKDKIKSLNSYRKSKKLNFKICCDGGINEKNIEWLAKNGVNIVGVSSAIFEKKNKITAIKNLIKLSNYARQVSNLRPTD